MRLLVRATNWVGDVVMSLPAVRALAASFPKDEISVLARPWVADLYRLRPEIRRVLVEDPKGEHAGWKGRERLAAELRGHAFDRAVLFPTSFGTAWTLFRAGIPERVGWPGEGRAPLLTRRVRQELVPGEHQVWKHLRVAEAAGAAMPDAPDVSWSVGGPVQESARNLLRGQGWDGSPFVAVHLASFAHAAKRWDLGRFAAVLDGLGRERGLHAVLLGSAGERAVNAEAAARVTGSRVIDLAGRSTLPDVLGVLSLASLFLGNDSGISHLAGAVGVPAVVVFGPTDPDATRPWDGPRGDGRPVRIRLARSAPLCAPCRFDICPIDHRCMSGVSVGSVLAAARASLDRT